MSVEFTNSTFYPFSLKLTWLFAPSDCQVHTKFRSLFKIGQYSTDGWLFIGVVLIFKMKAEDSKSDESIDSFSQIWNNDVMTPVIFTVIFQDSLFPNFYKRYIKKSRPILLVFLFNINLLRHVYWKALLEV